MIVKREGGLRKFKLGYFFFLDSGRQHGTHDSEEWGLLFGLCKCVLSTRHELVSQLGNLMLTLGKLLNSP